MGDGSQVRGSRKTYLVERYWPGVSDGAVTRAHERLAAETERLRGEGKRVRLRSSILIPREESVFSLIEAASEDDVAEANARAGVPFDRILEARTFASTTGERRSS